VLRDVYEVPRSMERFKAYLHAALGDTEDVVLPIFQANPMAKEHVIARLDELLAMGAEDIGEVAARDAASRLLASPGVLRTGLVIADDVAGGWTNRYTTEAMERFNNSAVLRRGFATGLLWASEEPASERIREEMLSTAYRAAYQMARGVPTTLHEMLTQEGLAAAFAGAGTALRRDELDRARSVIDRYLDAKLSTAYPTAFACMYGDVGADSVGYPALGLPPRAGFDVGLAIVLEKGEDPVDALESR
jgi:hypothetical protein